MRAAARCAFTCDGQATQLGLHAEQVLDCLGRVAFQIVFAPKRMYRAQTKSLALSHQKFPRTAVPLSVQLLIAKPLRLLKFSRDFFRTRLKHHLAFRLPVSPILTVEPMNWPAVHR